jgi:alpha-ketoglutaric semialdehyde dehydrogenase
MGLQGQSFIGYRRGSTSGKVLKAFDPTHGTILEPAFYSTSKSEAEEAIALAARSFATYASLDRHKRAGFLRGIADNLMSLGEQLVERAVSESGLTAMRIRNERERTCSQLRFFADMVEEGSWVDARIDRGDPERKPAPKPDIRSLQRPLGPIAVYCASNFPLAFSVAGGDTASALAAGNPVIVLAHYSHPGTAEYAATAIRDAAMSAGLPDGVFSLLYDAGIDIAHVLVNHPDIKGAGFTGSRAGGTALMKAAAARPEPIPFYAEMSSVNPVFILPGILQSQADTIAKNLHASATLGMGQFCTQPGIVITLDSSESFVLKFTELMLQTAAGVLLNRNISSAYQRAMSERPQRANITLKTATLDEPASAAETCSVRASVLETDAASWLADPVLHEEVFGPSTLLVHASGREDLLRIAREMKGNLTATILGTEEELADYADLAKILEQKVGRVLFNSYPTGVEVCEAMVHGGPFPATSDGRSTSVGGRAILRFTRPVCFQNFPDSALPAELQQANPLKIWRMEDRRYIQG